MNSISCDVCLDLMPLVKDGIASQDSINLVKEHIENCEECKNYYIQQPEFNVNDKKIIKSIKKSVYIFSIIILVAGCLLGSAITNGINVFYNFLIMPSLGALSYIILKKKSFFVPLIIFVVSFSWLTLEEFIKYKIFSPSGIIYSVFYLILSFLGIIIAMLLKFAFRKETKL